MTTYLGFDVLGVVHNYREDQTDNSPRSLTELNPGYGERYVAQRGPAPARSRSFIWTCKNRAEIAALKAWFATRKGQAVPFWYVTRTRDLVVAQNVGPLDTTMSIKACGYAKYAYPVPARRHLAFWINDSPVLRAASYATQNGGTETVGLANVLGGTITAYAGTWISYLTLCRLGSDELVLEWITDSLAEAKLTFIEIPQEVPE